jgi:NADH-quinone oxidoreductase subunit J
VSAGGQAVGAMQIGAVQVGVALFGPYVLAVELASMLLLAGLVAAFHLGRHE